MLAEYRRIIDLEDEEKIGQQFMAMGELLGYRALPSYRLDEGIERWKDYRSWTDERTLAEVIVYGRELLAQEAAVKEATAQKSKMRQAEQRLVALEQRTKEQQERIAELEHQVEPNEIREAIHQECEAAADRLRHRIAELEREVTQQQAMSEAQEQNIENYRKKLAQASERISKLERQVDVQRQQLGQYHQRFYPSSRAVAEQRLMALGAALNYKILLKYDNVAVEVPSGEQAWREFATHASYEDVAQAILQAQYLFDNLQALGMLAKRDSLVDHE